jgi:hypothetical protein
MRHFEIKARASSREKPAAVICEEWIQSGRLYELGPYCEMTQWRQ